MGLTRLEFSSNHANTVSIGIQLISILIYVYVVTQLIKLVLFYTATGWTYVYF